MQEPIVEVIHLKKVFHNIEAVQDVSFTVPTGICFGLLGPNGAGKTTTMEVIEDIIPQTAGQILYKGKPRTESFREEIGIQFQRTSLLNFMSVKETLVSFYNLFHHPEDMDELINRCDLSSIINRQNTTLSGGQQQRLMLALALINRPDLVFLDEPSTGLDPQSRRNLWEIVEGIKREGKTIIMTTHSMEEAEFLCDEIAIMDGGRIIANGSPKSLISTHCHGSTILLPRHAFSMDIQDLPFTWRMRDDMIEIDTDNIHQGLTRMLELQIELSEMLVRSANLEDVFLRLTGKQLRD
ncbi:MAG: ABC transporter ATP-binding protein [Desulfocapsaceae bacterium]|nr:ABC transporter ATP-binding protein [Desulfocapsaceae bacterium]